jgi:ABC-type branched-subunit amino acid transport system substrate-binding protein
MKKSLYILIVVFLVAVISGCDDSEDTSEQDSISGYSVRIGGIFPFSGALSEPAKQFHHSALLAKKHLEEAGYPIGWAVANSETNRFTGVKVARELIEEGKAQVLIASYASSVTIRIATEVSIPLRVPQISYGSTSPELTMLPEDEGQDLLFRTSSPDSLQGSVLAKLAMDEGYTQVAVLCADNLYGRSIKDVFVEQFRARGGEVNNIVIHPIRPDYLSGEILIGGDYTAELQLAAQGGVTTLVALSYLGHANDYVKQADAHGFKNFLFVDGTKSLRLIDTVGAEKLEGMCGTAPASKPSESLNIFEQAYLDEYGKADYNIMKIFPFMSNTYDAVIIAGLAAYAAQAMGEEVTSYTIRNYIRSVAGQDRDGDGQIDGEKVKTGSKELKRAMKILDSGRTINYEGASGRLDFDQYGDVITPIEIWCYKNGQIISRDLCEINDLNHIPFADITCQPK